MIAASVSWNICTRMPRAKRHKNRYCWNTKIAEDVFLRLIKEYANGSTATAAAEKVSRWCVRSGQKPVTRPTVSNLFLRIGDYLFFQFYWVEQRGTAEASGKILRLMFDMTYGQVDFNEWRKEVGQETSSLLFYKVLRERSKANSGLEYRYFASQVGFASHMKTAIEIAAAQGKDDAASASRELYKALERLLRHEPLGSVEFPIVRLHREIRDGIPFAYFVVESSED